MSINDGFLENAVRETGGPAYWTPNADSPEDITPGMTLRDYYAGKAPFDMDHAANAFLAEHHRKANVGEARAYFAFLSFAYADAMLAERAK